MSDSPGATERQGKPIADCPDHAASTWRGSSARVASGKISVEAGARRVQADVGDGQERGRHHPEQGFEQISDRRALAAIIDEVVANNPKSVADYRAARSAPWRARRPGDEGDARQGEPDARERDAD